MVLTCFKINTSQKLGGGGPVIVTRIPLWEYGGLPPLFVRPQPNSHYGLAESSRTPPAFKSARRISTAAREMAMPTFRSGVRTKRTVVRCVPGPREKIICEFVSPRPGLVNLPFSCTRHAG